ncbi:sterile alpha motif domain-containing protein 7 [Pantherophis guttatus]|uniref:Sterile alpha motif domain-containing protein 7 n=1 Tax=Pantherophis guttatus TaxID=94885 RepID=A0A6P9DK97_PANGU|nr:sterile alpha motif domain-containing protein 7 [Pantherophis guttatus]
MNPQDHMRKMIILGKQRSVEDGAFYQIGSGIPAADLRQQQETLMRSQFMTGHPTLMRQHEMQTIPSQLESRFVERHLLPTSEILVPADLRQIHVASTLGPPTSQLGNFPNLLSSCVSQGPGYSFLQSESMEAVAKRQELIQKQNIARMEMSAMFQQKELEKAQRKSLLKLRGFFPYPDVPARSASFQERHCIPEGHLSNGLYVHQTTLNELQRNAVFTGTSSYPPLSMLQRERVRRPSRRAGIRKASRYQFNHGKNQLEDRDLASVTLSEEKEDKKETKVEMPSKPPEAEQEVHAEPLAAVTKNEKEREGGLRKNLCNHKMPSDATDGHNGNEKDSHNSCLVFNEKHADPSKITFSALTSSFSMLNQPPLSFASPRLTLNGEEISSAEDIRKWTVEDVYSFINSLPGCSEYAQVFKDHVIDGETLPLLTEEHLLDMMGLKLGPALKIQSQVSQCLRNIFCTMNIPLAMPNPYATSTSSEPFHDTVSHLPSDSAHTILASPCTQDPEISKTVEQVISESTDNNLF